MSGGSSPFSQFQSMNGGAQRQTFGMDVDNDFGGFGGFSGFGGPPGARFVQTIII